MRRTHYKVRKAKGIVFANLGRDIMDGPQIDNIKNCVGKLDTEGGFIFINGDFKRPGTLILGASPKSQKKIRIGL